MPFENRHASYACRKQARQVSLLLTCKRSFAEAIETGVRRRVPGGPPGGRRAPKRRAPFAHTCPGRQRRSTFGKTSDCLRHPTPLNSVRIIEASSNAFRLPYSGPSDLLPLETARRWMLARSPAGQPLFRWTLHRPVFKISIWRNGPSPREI